MVVLSGQSNGVEIQNDMGAISVAKITFTGENAVTFSSPSVVTLVGDSSKKILQMDASGTVNVTAPLLLSTSGTNVVGIAAGTKNLLTTDKPAFFVWINATGVRGEFDDNSFALLPGEPRTLTFTPKDHTDAETFVNSISVTDLSKSYDSTQSARSTRLKQNKEQQQGVMK